MAFYLSNKTKFIICFFVNTSSQIQIFLTKIFRYWFNKITTKDTKKPKKKQIYFKGKLLILYLIFMKWYLLTAARWHNSVRVEL